MEIKTCIFIGAGGPTAVQRVLLAGGGSAPFPPTGAEVEPALQLLTLFREEVTLFLPSGGGGGGVKQKGTTAQPEAKVTA